MAVVIAEIMQDKIYLDITGRVMTVAGDSADEIEGGTVDLTQAN